MRVLCETPYMDAGKVEVSCGYECDCLETPGEDPQYGRYDAIQTNIAVSEGGRAVTAQALALYRAELRAADRGYGPAIPEPHLPPIGWLTRLVRWWRAPRGAWPVARLMPGDSRTATPTRRALPGVR